ncbi:MAG TPA: ribosome-associated translation inhibitor RaiA [Clostridiales bacterium]|nr:ribosome-associated translation inhibitor RaiA [Clostridiales bacterium]
MKVIISSKNINPSDRLKETIEKKLEKLSKYFSEDIVANVTLVGGQKGRQKIEATINAKGTIFRAEEDATDIYTGIDRIIDKLSSQMSRFKTKLQRKHKDHRDIDFSMVPEVEEVPKTEVIRKKTFDMIPMSQDEAIMQMELLSHNFFVFLNMETDSVAVVYKRKDGGYGLLEPSY